MADRYWVNDDADGDWNVANNWSATDGGAGGAGVPTASDDVYFTSSCTDNCSLSANASCTNFYVQDGYAGTINGVTYDVAISNDFTSPDSSTVWTMAWGSGTWTIGGNCNAYYRGDAGNQTGLVLLTGAAKTVCIGRIYHVNAKVAVQVTGSYTITGYPTSWGKAVLISGSGSLTNQAIYGNEFAGGLTLSDTGTFNATSDGVGITSVDLVIASTATFTLGSGHTLHLGNVDLLNDAAITLGGNLKFYSYSGGSVVIKSDVTVQGDFSAGGYNAVMNVRLDTYSPSLAIQGDVITLYDNTTWHKGTGTITLSGSADQDIDFNGESVEDIVIDKTAGNVVLTGNVQTDSFTGTSTGTGDFDPNGKTITVDGNCSWAADFDFDSAADCLNGCSWVVDGNFTANGQSLKATAGWSLEVAGTAVASGAGDVAYCDANALHTEIDASAGPWTDNGNNTNWSFGAAAAIMNQFQGANVGADLFNGTLIGA